MRIMRFTHFSRTGACAIAFAVQLIAGCSDGGGSQSSQPQIPSDEPEVTGQQTDAGPSSPSNESGDTSIGQVEDHSAPIGNDIESSTYYISGTNSARISGPVIGSGAFANRTLRKRIPVELVDGDRRVFVDYAYITRNGDARNFLNTRALIVPIRNISLGAICNIDAPDIRAFGIDDEEIGSDLPDDEPRDSNVRLFGTAQQISPDTLSVASNCLASGETGFMGGGLDGDFNGRYDDIERIEIPQVRYSEDIFGEPQARPFGYSGQVVPLDYTVQSTERADTFDISIRVKNNLTELIEFNNLRVFALDETGAPMSEQIFASVLGGADDVLLEPGQEHTGSQRMSFRGTSSSLRVTVNFKVAPDTF